LTCGQADGTPLLISAATLGHGGFVSLGWGHLRPALVAEFVEKQSYDPARLADSVAQTAVQSPDLIPILRIETNTRPYDARSLRPQV
jgi:hypothetical protein